MTFENFLQDKFAETYTGLDDDMPDRFDAWLENLEIDLLLAFADLYAMKFARTQIEQLSKNLFPLNH